MSDKRFYYITDEDYATAEKNGISRRAVWYRVHDKGMDIDTAITLPMRSREDMKEYTEIAEEHGVPRAVFYNRKHRGMDLLEAATKPVMNRKDAMHKARSVGNNLFTREEIEQAEANGVKYPTLYNRHKRLGWSKERAMTEPVWSQDKQMKELAKKDNYFRQLERADWGVRSPYAAEREMRA